MKDLYVYKWVPGQINYFIHFDLLSPRNVTGNDNFDYHTVYSAEVGLYGIALFGNPPEYSF